MSNFDTAVNFVLRQEGVLNENPSDRGGITKYGISLRFLKSVPLENLKRYGIFDNEVTEDTIRHLSLDSAKKIYYGEFWQHAPFEKILNQEHTNYIFDMAINLGIAPAIKCVQRACWAVMRHWGELKDDGILGEKTLDAITRCGFLIMPPLRAERANHYRALIALYPDQEKFINTWFDRTYDAR
jgi:lysozyme family protein